MHFHIITLFPELIEPYVQTSIIGRAQSGGVVSVSVYNPREYTDDPHRRVDDVPYGGGPGMVLQAEPILRAYDAAVGDAKHVTTFVFSPQGEQFTNKQAQSIASSPETDIVLICGRYEGIDARVVQALKAKEVSIGPYVLTGGELPALVLLDAVARQIPGVLGKEESNEEERFASAELYTRPSSLTYHGKQYTVPEVLRSGDHKKIAQWREERHTYD